MNKSESGTALSRRNFVAGVGGAGVAAGLMTIPQAAHAAGGGTAISGFFDVTKSPYSAVSDGSAPTQGAIQHAIDDAVLNGGGIVWLPPGIYWLSAGLTIGSQVVLAGAGWTTPPSDLAGHPTNDAGNGTWFLVGNTSFTPITISGFGASVRDIAFVHAQNINVTSNWAPVDFPYTIEINAQDVLLENIFFRNATRGIVMRASAVHLVGRITLKHIWGQPIVEGVRIDNATDVIKIDDVHFWPFWSFCPQVLDYQRYGSNNAFVFQRVDNPHLTNIFVLGYRRGFYFTSSTGTYGGFTSRFLMSNCGVDNSPTGIEIDGAGTSGMVSNFYSLGGTNGVSGIVVNADNVLLQCSNIRATLFNTSAVLVAGNNSHVSLENIALELWNQAGTGFPAIQCNAPATTYIGRGRIFLTSSGPQTGGTGTFVMDN